MKQKTVRLALIIFVVIACLLMATHIFLSLSIGSPWQSLSKMERDFDENSESSGYEYTENDKNSFTLSWKVEPIFEYQYVRSCTNCGFFAVTNDSNEPVLIDAITGEITGMYIGHGLQLTRLLYDEQLSLFGMIEGDEGGDDFSIYTA